MTMRRWMVVWTVAAVVALAQSAAAVQEMDLDRAGLKAEASQNRALRQYLKRNGLPDVAQVRPVQDQPPWDDHEVTLYYIGMRKEISFARARILGHPEIHTTRYRRLMTDEDIRSLQAHTGRLSADAGAKVATSTPTCTGSATERAECSATRAENVADRLDAAAEKTEQAADRTEAIATKMAAHRTSAHHKATTPRKRAQAVPTPPAS
jgi:hypothetical protein